MRINHNFVGIDSYHSYARKNGEILKYHEISKSRLIMTTDFTKSHKIMRLTHPPVVLDLSCTSLFNWRVFSGKTGFVIGDLVIKRGEKIIKQFKTGIKLVTI